MATPQMGCSFRQYSRVSPWEMYIQTVWLCPFELPVRLITRLSLGIHAIAPSDAETNYFDSSAQTGLLSGCLWSFSSGGGRTSCNGWVVSKGESATTLWS